MAGEEQYGLETVVEVEDDRGWKRFWGRDKSFFGGKAQEGGSIRKMDSRFADFGNWFHAARRDGGGERSRI